MAATSEDAAADESEGYDQIPPQQRKKALQRDNHSCQLCPRKGPQAGGNTPLHVHHKTYEPDDCDLHDLDNLITLCIHCHGWHHSRPTPDLPSVDITEEARVKLIPVDFEIIDLICREGLLTIDEISEGITPNKCRLAIKDCLWRIMGIDTVVEEQEQLIDQDADTGRWGLPSQIEFSKRHGPTTIYETVQRTIDRIVAEALDRGCDRETISDVIDIDPRTVNRIGHRGQAYAFTLDRYTGPGRPPKDGFELPRRSATDGGDVADNQQYLDELPGDEAIDEDATGDTDGVADDDTDADAAGVDAGAGDNDTRTTDGNGDHNGDDSDAVDAGEGVTADAENNADAGANRDVEDGGDVGAGRRRGWCHRR